jgi:hypothetical protein
MVTKSKKGSAKKGRVKVGKLKLNKETVKDLSASEKGRIKGGAVIGLHSDQVVCGLAKDQRLTDVCGVSEACGVSQACGASQACK